MNFADFEKLMRGGIVQAQTTGQLVRLSFSDADLESLPENTPESGVVEDGDDSAQKVSLAVHSGDDEGQPIYSESED